MNQHAAPPSLVRYRIIAISVLMAFTLYLHRVCLGEVVKSDSFKADMELSNEAVGRILGAFFFTYALCQVPAGWISDRWGARRMLGGYILGWSTLTGLSGLMTGAGGLMLARFGFGAAQAGAYPTSSAVVRNWFPLSQRGKASSLVSFGGRLGGSLAPVLTTMLILSVGGWRPTMWLYGILGVLVGFGYYSIVRDRPAEHPSCNEAERAWIGEHDDHDEDLLPAGFWSVIFACMTSRSLWLNSLGQFCINVGWAFLITWLPTYLKDVQQVPDRTGSIMVTVVLSMGMLGQLVGGWATDASVRMIGLRFGRILPITIATWLAGLSYLGCIAFDSAIAVVICCAMVSFLNDVGNPSIWAFMQDVGGRSTATVFGWANMWGNMGAAAISVMVPYLMSYGESTSYGQSFVFIACALAFFIAGLAALGMNPTRKIVIRD